MERVIVFHPGLDKIVTFKKDGWFPEASSQ